MYRPNPSDPPPNPQQHRPHDVPEGPDPNERLAQLKVELKQQQDRLNHLGKQTEGLQTDIDDLEKTVGEVKTTVADYGSEVKDLETKLHELNYFYQLKHRMIMAAIGDEKEPIDELIREFDRELERMQDRLTELGKLRAAARGESEEADRIQAEEQAEYDQVKGYKQSTENGLEELAGLRGDITSADDANDAASMYFLVLEFQNILRQTHILSQHHLAQELKQKLGDLESAKENARAKKAHWDHLATEYDAHEGTLKIKRESRRQHLLGAVQAMFPAHKQQEAAVAQTAPGTSVAATGQK
jgi:septal ring factor EnvC (AmiA/AmiB activator)